MFQDSSSDNSSINSNTPPYVIYREGMVKGNPLFDESEL